MTSALGHTALVTNKYIFRLQIPSQILLGLPHNAEGWGHAQRRLLLLRSQADQTNIQRLAGTTFPPKSKNTTVVLTVNNDLCLLAVSGANAGDIAAVDASVSDIDFVDTQDAHSLCGL